MSVPGEDEEWGQAVVQSGCHHRDPATHVAGHCFIFSIFPLKGDDEQGTKASCHGRIGFACWLCGG